MNKNNEASTASEAATEQVDQLAAEFVLGTLASSARQTVEKRLRQEPLLAERVQYWEELLADINQQLPPLAPPSELWDKIAQRLSGQARNSEAKTFLAVANRKSASLFGGFWRGLSSGVVLASFVAALLWFSFGQRDSQFNMDMTAVLSSTDAAVERQSNWLAAVNLSTNQLQITRINATPVPSGKTMELWVIPKDGSAPIPCGLMDDVQQQLITVASSRMLLDAKALAISLEPAGGSPTGQPTGPVVYMGGIQAGSV